MRHPALLAEKDDEFGVLEQALVLHRHQHGGARLSHGVVGDQRARAPDRDQTGLWLGDQTFQPTLFLTDMGGPVETAETVEIRLLGNQMQGILIRHGREFTHSATPGNQVSHVSPIEAPM